MTISLRHFCEASNFTTWKIVKRHWTQCLLTKHAYHMGACVELKLTVTMKSVRNGVRDMPIPIGPTVQHQSLEPRENYTRLRYSQLPEC